MEDAQKLSSLKTVAAVVYALHAIGFFSGITWIVAVIVNYVKLDDARGTWLESHFRWQIRTFWFGLLWTVLCGLFVVFTLGIGLIVVWVPFLFVGFWFVYRIVRGWLALRDRRLMPV
jgi:uncharacterized membrane protein